MVVGRIDCCFSLSLVGPPRELAQCATGAVLEDAPLDRAVRGARHASVRCIVGACDRRFRSLSSQRDRSPMIAPRSPLALVLLLASSITLADDMVARSFCDAPPYDQVCAVAPRDNTDFDAAFIYHNLEKNAQNPFDIFSWQSFVALNWPADEAGAPIGEPIGTHPNLPRVWQSYKQPGEVFGFTGEDQPCHSGAAAEIATDMILQSSGKPLIDRDLNYIVFDTRMNGRLEQYIVATGLDSAQGQRRFQQAGKVVDLPLGHYQDKSARTGGELGAIAVKTSWKIIDAGASEEAGSYYTVDGLIAVPAARSETGEALCIRTRIGLIGMHIMHRTASGNGGDWLWSTFEHVNAAPIADNALDPNNILGELFADGCLADTVESQRYVLFNPELQGLSDQHDPRGRVEVVRRCTACPRPCHARRVRNPGGAVLADLREHRSREQGLARQASRHGVEQLPANHHPVARLSQQRAVSQRRGAPISDQRDVGDLRPIQPRRNVHGLPREGDYPRWTGRQLQLPSEQSEVTGGAE